VPARQTPATRAASAAGVAFRLHEYSHDSGAPSFALEAAEALNLEPARVFKTLVVTHDEHLKVCLVPSDATLNLRGLGKHAALAPPDRAQAATGYVVGGITPLVSGVGSRRSSTRAPSSTRRSSSAPGAAASRWSWRQTIWSR
jgi:Cys-tRNA(Pro)/Cys-tRNA(Cys) deacylase